MPAPGVPWEGESLSGSSGSWEENLHRDWAVSTVETTAMAVGELPVKTGNNVALNRTEYMASPVEGNSGGSAAAAAGAAAIESCVVTRTRRDAVDKLLRSVDGRNEAGGVVVPLWGPNEVCTASPPEQPHTRVGFYELGNPYEACRYRPAKW